MKTSTLSKFGKPKRKHTMQTTYEIHKIASYYPKISGKDYTALRASIKRDGLLNSITLFEGKILDGTNRYRACIDEGVEPHFRQLPEGMDPVDFVISQNDTRRHLTKEQLVLIGARLATVRHGGSRKDGYKDSETAGKSVAKVAEKLKVSKSGIKRAQAVLKKGAPEVVDALEASELTVHEAEQISHLPQETQPSVLSAMREDKVAAKAAREELKKAKKSGVVKTAKPVLTDLDKRWKEFLPQFKMLLKLFKTFKSEAEHTEIRHRVMESLHEIIP